jgi:hypothetical protein
MLACLAKCLESFFRDPERDGLVWADAVPRAIQQDTQVQLELKGTGSRESYIGFK